MAHRIELDFALEALKAEAVTLEAHRLREVTDVASLSAAVRQMEAEVEVIDLKHIRSSLPPPEPTRTHQPQLAPGRRLQPTPAPRPNA